MGRIAQANAGPAHSSTLACNGKPAKSQPTPGKPSTPIGSSYAASFAGLSRRARTGMRPENFSGAAASASRPAVRSPAVASQAVRANDANPASTTSAAGARTSADPGSSDPPADPEPAPWSSRWSSTPGNAKPAAEEGPGEGGRSVAWVGGGRARRRGLPGGRRKYGRARKTPSEGGGSSAEGRLAPRGGGAVPPGWGAGGNSAPATSIVRPVTRLMC